MHTSIAVANKFIEKAQNEGISLTPMKLIKLVYLAHGWMLGVYGRPLVKDSIEAWQYGPVIPDLYHEVKSFRDRPVTNKLMTLDTKEFSQEEQWIINEVVRVYGNYSGIQLSQLTHQTGSPWHQTWIPGSRGIHMSNDLIEHHYKLKYSESRAAANNANG
jgi:uncharacterized phage-associated protein